MIPVPLKHRSLFTCLLSSLALGYPAYAAVHAESSTFRASDGVTLHYLEAGARGDSPAIVFIPGWTMAADIFQPQIDALSARFRVIALDPRSQGESEKTADDNTLERHAKDIEELFEHLQLSRAVLVGWSNGVPDVLSFVEQNGASKLSGAVLVDGLLKVGEMQASMSAMLKNFQAARVKFTDGFVRGMYNTPQTDQYIAHVKNQSLKTPTNTAVVEIFNVVSRGDFTPILPKLDKPVMYVCEQYLAAQGKILQAHLPTARVEIFPKAGHALFVDEAEKFNALLAEFITSLP